MTMLKMKYIVVLLLSISLLSCGLIDQSTVGEEPLEDTLTYPLQKLPFPNDFFFSLTWLPNNKIMVSDKENRYFIFDLETARARELLFPQDPACTLRTIYIFPVVLPTDDVGFVKECGVVDKRQPKRYSVAINLKTSEVNRLVEKPLPPIGGDYFSWNPQMTQGIQDTGSILGTIYLLTPEEAKPLDVEIDGWSLAKNYDVMMARSSQDDIGIVRASNWSPDGERIAFMASTDAIGRSGIERIKRPYQLYLLSADFAHLEAVLEDIYYAHTVYWDPTSRFIAFNGNMGNLNNSGMWIFDVDRRELTQISDSHISRLHWSPDGKSLIVLRECEAGTCLENSSEVEAIWGEFNLEGCDSDDIYCTEVVRFDVTALVDG